MKQVIAMAIILLLLCTVIAVANVDYWILNIKVTDMMGNNYFLYQPTHIGWSVGHTDETEALENNGMPPLSIQGYDCVVVAWLPDTSKPSIVDYRKAYSLNPTLPKVWNMFAWWRATTMSMGNMVITMTPHFNSRLNFPYSAGLQLVVNAPNAVGTQKTWTFTDSNQLPSTGFSFILPESTEYPDSHSNIPDFTITVAAIPEPSGLLALYGGIAGLLVFRRRRR